MTRPSPFAAAEPSPSQLNWADKGGLATTIATMTELAERRSLDGVAPGVVVVIRDEQWLVTQVTNTSDGLLLTCQGLSELVQGTTAQFFEALEESIEVADPRNTKVVPDVSSRYRLARLWLEATLRKMPLAVDDLNLAVVDDMLIDPLEYQRTAVRKALNPETLRPRLLLADTVGLGKTAEIGMILSELVRRGRGERILIVTPRHVLEQMQHEMWTRFSLPFVRLDSVGIQRVRRRLPASRNPFSVYKRAIVSIDTLKNDTYLNHLRKFRWDAVVIDESHNITNRSTQNNRLAATVAPMTDALILASATPHNGKKESFAELVRLLEPTAVSPDDDINEDELSRLVVRRHRHSPEVASYVGGEWKERLEPKNVAVDASPIENTIAQRLADDWLYTSSADPLFGWTLAKAFLSSPAALRETAQNRLKNAKHPEERDKLQALVELATQGEAEKGGKYAALLQELHRIGIAKASPERVVIFAERVATLGWLRQRIAKDLKLADDQVGVLHGGLSDVEQQAIVDSFKQQGSPLRVLVTGDVASEGVNLHQQCHELIHYDIPWSLIRIEQRNGRIDRYGQMQHPQITTLLLQPDHERFSGDIRVLTQLMKKEHEAHRALGDSASLMGKHSVEAEERAILDVLRGSKDLDDVVSTLEEVSTKDTFDAWLLRFQNAMPADELLRSAAASDVAEQPSAPTDLPHVGTGLYDTPAAYLRDAVAECFPRPQDQPQPGGEGGLGWVEYPGEHIVELTPPEDLKARLAVLPQTYLRDREVTKRMRLATNPVKGKQLLKDALSDTTGSSWPAAHYLGPLHPVLEWISDRVLTKLTRGQVFAVRGDVEAPTVLLTGSLTNKAGQTVAATWMSVAFPLEGNTTFTEPQLHASAAEMLASCGVSASVPNPGAVAGVDDLTTLIPPSVGAAERVMAPAIEAATRAAEARVTEWVERAETWSERANAAKNRLALRERRTSVEQEQELARLRRPERHHVRPLLVVVPADHPVATSEEGVR